MTGILLCLFAFAVTYWLAGRSLGSGFLALSAVGYGYGLIRARLGDVGSHFLFDAALLGFYGGAFSRPLSEALRSRSQTATTWTLVLMAWPLVCMAYSPLIGDAQPLLVQTVGLRDTLLLLPCVILGARMTRDDVDALASGLAILNVIAFGFGLLEYVYGIEPFLPRSAATAVIYQSQDITTAGGTFYRIPATFVSSHVYGGTMAISVAFVAHGLESQRNVRILSWAGLGAAVAGIFLCGARLPVVVLALATAYVLGSRRMRFSTIFSFAITAGGVAYVVATFERFQRFTTLNNSELVRDRIGQSVSLSFVDILTSYPFGAGLASGAGTNIPYFLSDTPGIHAQIGLESEYSRLLLEEGILGLSIWIAFFVFSSIRKQRVQDASPTATAYMQALLALTWLTGLLGTGALFSIPETSLVFIALGMRLANPAPARAVRGVRIVGGSRATSSGAGTAGALAVQRASR